MLKIITFIFITIGRWLYSLVVQKDSPPWFIVLTMTHGVSIMYITWSYWFNSLRGSWFVLLVYSIWKWLYAFLKHKHLKMIICTFKAQVWLPFVLHIELYKCEVYPDFLHCRTTGKRKECSAENQVPAMGPNVPRGNAHKSLFLCIRPLHLLFEQIFKNTNDDIKWIKCRSFLLSLSLKVTSHWFLFRSHACCLLFFFSLSSPL